MNTDFDLSSMPEWLLVVLGVLVAVQITVEIYALVVLFRTPDERLQFGKKWPWVLIILLVNLVGAIVFLAAGRKPAPAVDPMAVPTGPTPPDTPDRAARATEVLYGPRDGDAS